MIGRLRRGSFIESVSFLISILLTLSFLACLTPDMSLKNKVKCFLWGLFLGGCLFVANILFIQTAPEDKQLLYHVMPFILPWILNYTYLFSTQLHNQFEEKHKKRIQELEKEIKELKARINAQ